MGFLTKFLGIGATFGGASGATIKAARFYKALKFTTSSRSWKWKNISQTLHRPAWNFAARGQQIHHWLIPQKTWGKYIPNRIKNQPWNLKPMRSNVLHQRIHGASPNMNAFSRIWHGSPAWAKPVAAGIGVSLGNHAGRTMNNYSSGRQRK